MRTCMRACVYVCVRACNGTICTWLLFCYVRACVRARILVCSGKVIFAIFKVL